MARQCGLGAEAVAGRLKEQVRTLRGHVASARAQDPEGIHDLRVASRRLRAVLSECSPFLGRAERKAFQGRIASVTRLLGKARELDVTLGLLDALREDLHGPPRFALNFLSRRLRAKRAAESPSVSSCVALLESSNFNTELMALFESLAPRNTCYLKDAQSRLKKRTATLATRYHSWQSTPPGPRREQRLHRVRIQFKKLRYTCEIYAELYGPAMKGFLRDLKAAQESLGSWNDFRVLREYLAEAMEADPPSVARQGMPVLCNVVDDLVHSLLETFRDSSAEFFSPSRTKETRKLMRGVRAQCCDFKTSPLVDEG